MWGLQPTIFDGMWVHFCTNFHASRVPNFICWYGKSQEVCLPPWLDNTFPISIGNRSNSQRNQSFFSNGLLDTTHLLMRYLCYVTARLFLFHVHSPSSHKSFGSGYHHGPSSRKSSAGASSLASTGSVQSSPGNTTLHLYWMPNSVSIGFGTAIKTGSSRRFKRYPTTYGWVSSQLPFTAD